MGRAEGLKCLTTRRFGGRYWMLPRIARNSDGQRKDVKGLESHWNHAPGKFNILKGSFGRYRYTMVHRTLLYL